MDGTASEAYHGIYIDSNNPRANPMTLFNGDCLTQEVFHELYEEIGEDFRAELVDGIVFVREPLGIGHGETHSRLTTILGNYGGLTSGVQTLADATVILGPKDEVQPDVLIRIKPECGGQTENWIYRKKKKKTAYVKGAPEFVAEISHSSRAIDLHLKKKRYTRAGVQEYLVVCLNPIGIHWFDLQNKTMIQPGDDGVFRSAVLPGLWIDGAALFDLNFQKSMEVLNAGIASSEHKKFVDALSARQ
jgi:Uma2 family endonuclease